jgi:hypothetical protein
LMNMACASITAKAGGFSPTNLSFSIKKVVLNIYPFTINHLYPQILSDS